MKKIITEMRKVGDENFVRVRGRNIISTWNLNKKYKKNNGGNNEKINTKEKF